MKESFLNFTLNNMIFHQTGSKGLSPIRFPQRKQVARSLHSINDKLKNSLFSK